MRTRSGPRAVLLLLPLLISCATTRAPEPTPAAPPSTELLTESLPTDSRVTVDTLPNGLRYYIRVNDEPKERAELRLVVNAGSVLEDEDQRGLAHFVEHMAFNGTRNFAEQELVDYLESIGMRFGPDVNAYTSFDETVYKLTVPTDSAGVMETGFQILEDWATGITFDSLEVEKERGVIIEEWRLGQGAAARMRDQQFPILFKDSRYAERLPIGDRATLERFDHDALTRFYEDWYRPELMAVVAVGDFDAARIEQLIRRHFADIPPAKEPRPRREFEIPPHEDTRFAIATDPEATGSSVSLYLKSRPEEWAAVGDYRRWLVESLASGMLGNRLVERTHEPDSPFLDISSFQGRVLRPLSAFVLNASVEDGGIGRGLEALLTAAGRAARHGFTASEFEREKMEMLRRLERQYAERDKAYSAGFAAQYTSQYLYGGSILSDSARYTLATRLIPTIELRTVNGVAADWLRTGNRVILANAPEREGAPVPGEAGLSTIIEAVGERPVTAYVDETSDAPLVPNPPRPGRVVAEREFPEADVVEWTLDNGVRVLLKPTDFRNDQVLLAGRSLGGTSLAPDEDYVAALTATAVVQAGGVGELDLIELQKRLSGKVASVGASIGDLHETVSGAASPADMETLFQLVYLKFTAPRLDSAAVRVYQSRARATLANRSASPEAHFSDTLRVTLAQGHPRARPPSVALFDSLDLGRSLEIYRDRFADAGDFTFYLVGSFNVDSIQPLVERYLGGLPSLDRTEHWRDVGIEPPTGVVRKVVRKGIEPKARTRIVFTGPLDFDRGSLYALQSLADVLEIRLRELLREELGGTYGASVGASGSRDPDEEYRFAIGFGASPDRLDELTEAVFAQIDLLKTAGATDAELAKVRETQQRTREVQLRQNHFWLTRLMSYDRYGWDFGDILANEQHREYLDSDLIRRAAQQFLNTENYVQVLLVPEG